MLIFKCKKRNKKASDKILPPKITEIKQFFFICAKIYSSVKITLYFSVKIRHKYRAVEL